jgi:hypothetical protein
LTVKVVADAKVKEAARIARDPGTNERREFARISGIISADGSVSKMELFA